MHCELHVPPFVLMASDCPPDRPTVSGSNFSVCLTCESVAEEDRLFAALSAGGKVTLPLHDAFWGDRFGMLTDRFGISWMLSFRAA